MHQTSQTMNAQKSSVRTLLNWKSCSRSIFIAKLNIPNTYLFFCYIFSLDGGFFSKVNGYYCGSSYQTERGFANSTSKCKEDNNCAMVSTLQCTNGESVYSLCNKSTELVPKLEACTLWKIGNATTSKI